MTQSEIVAERRPLNLKVGDLVEVRGEEEILATLDENGELENLPFMPEMLRYCGQRLTVHKVAHKLCDTQTGTGMHRMDNAVHLTEARCDGSAHGGCQTACSMYWKEAWLKRVEPGSAPANGPVIAGRALKILQVNTRKPDGECYSCQATELLRAAPERLPFRDVRQFVTDVRVGNAGVFATLRTIFFGFFDRWQHFSKRALPKPLRIRGGMAWGWVRGGPSAKTPTASLGLQPGELVRIKSKEEIVSTLNSDRLNRGMGFEEEMARWCGRTARVRARVVRCIDERTGRMLTMKNPCIILEDVFCLGVYKVNCPREFLPYWREIWLERVEDSESR